jgi:hypothetical protein
VSTQKSSSVRDDEAASLYGSVKSLLEQNLEEARVGAAGYEAAEVWAEAHEAIDALRQVLALHYPAGGGVARLVCASCEELEPGNRGTWPMTWPCPTFTAIERGGVPCQHLVPLR